MTPQCDRCLGARGFRWTEVSICITGPMADSRRGRGIEIDEGEVEIGFYEGDGIELEDILREQVLLALPMQRVCSDALQGNLPGLRR